MHIFRIILGLLTISPAALFAALDFKTPLEDQLDPSVYEAPGVYRVPEQDVGEIRAIFFDTLDYEGKPTRAFAYLGIPKSDQPVPAMVLVHGGGGKAFSEWVKIWNDRGYAAISMSLEGHMPNAKGEGKLRHDFSGPQRVGMFADIGKPLEGQWMYHAVSDIMIAHSLMRALPEVDAERLGVTGISWGGVLSSLVSGVDHRFKCAMPVYGAGFLYESEGHFKDMSAQNAQELEQKKFWDPARHFSNGSMPTLWVNGDADGHFSVNITSRSFEASKDHAYMTIHPGMRHGHPPGWNPEEVPEIYAFADSILKGEGGGLGSITHQPSTRQVKLSYTSESPLIEATVYYLNEALTYRKPNEKAKHAAPGPWKTIVADVNASNKTVTAQLPETVKTYYVNLQDSRGHIISSVLVQLH